MSYAINWATIAPETRLYKGKDLFKWEASPGLEHHCGICATPLHNSRAKTSCIGKHVEPCYRFHQQLHFVGKSHECFGCNSSDEMHYSRHKDILKIIRQITRLDEPVSMMPPDRSACGKQRRGSSTTTTTATLTETGSECVSVDEPKVTKREKKKAKKSGNGHPKNRKSIEAFPLEETDFVSEAIHLSVHDSKGAWEGTYIYDHKHTTNEEGAINDNIDEDGDRSKGDSMSSHFEALAVKPPSTPVHTSTPRQRRVEKKLFTPVSYVHHSSGSRKYTSPTTALADAYGDVDPQVYVRLGIEIFNPKRNSKARKDLICKLVAAVKEDIDIIEREDRESKMREEGFWRWAGKTAYTTIMQTRENLDWATGQKRGPAIFDDGLEAEMDIDDAEALEVEMKASELAEMERACKSAKALSRKLDEDDGFTLAARKKPTPKPTKIVQGSKKKFVKVPISHVYMDPILDLDEEDDGEDAYEMIRRYEQRVAGEQNLGGAYTGSTPGRRVGRGGIINVK